MNKDEKLIAMLNRSAKVVGCRQVLRGLSEGTVRCVIVAEDAEDEVKDGLFKAAAEHNAEVLLAPSMDWLGRQTLIEVGAAAVGICKSED